MERRPYRGAPTVCPFGQNLLYEKVFERANRMTELDKKLAKAARECSADAVRRTFEAGRPITILVGNRVVRRWADGHEELVEELPPR